MHHPREALVDALVAKLRAISFATPVNGETGFVTVSRRLKLWSDVPKSLRPALFVTDHNETPAYQNAALPAKWTIDVALFVYIDASDRHVVPAVDLNIVLDAIEAGLAPAPADQGRLTLAGQTVYCRIDGRVLKDPGDLDGDGLLWIPLKIMAV